jgi:hypothetical protein
MGERCDNRLSEQHQAIDLPEEVHMRFRSVARRVEVMFACVLTQQQRRRLWPAASQLESKHVRNCKLFESRHVMLGYLPKESVCAEVGIDKGQFSDRILRITRPVKLHLIDISHFAIQNARQTFAQQIAQGTAPLLLSFPTEYFD